MGRVTPPPPAAQAVDRPASQPETHVDHGGAVAGGAPDHTGQQGEDVGPRKGLAHLTALGQLLVGGGAPTQQAQGEAWGGRAAKRP